MSMVMPDERLADILQSFSSITQPLICERNYLKGIVCHGQCHDETKNLVCNWWDNLPIELTVAQLVMTYIRDIVLPLDDEIKLLKE